MLEFGCGTGRVYLELRSADVDAYGLDVSGAMLDEPERKAAERGLTPRVRQADVTSFEPERDYALVVVPFRTFLHNTTLEDQQATSGTSTGRSLPGDGSRSTSSCRASRSSARPTANPSPGSSSGTAMSTS